MSLFEQKYKNNIRTISGLVNVPFQDDVVLNCNTSVAPVAIQLVSIPADYWNTTWKLFIVDGSNNASVNNITITAPIGFLINGGSSFTITVNNGSFLIRISSNTNFVGQYSVIGGGGGNGHIIANALGNLPQQPILKFTGAVTVINGVGQTIVDNGLVSVTNAQLIALILAGTNVPNQNYLVTDVANADEGVVVQTIKSNALTTVSGSGVFLNADYQKNGNYSGVVGFVSALGLWSSIVQPVVIGNCVVYNNKNYKNITGAWGTAPSTDVVNWVLLPKNITNGYLRVVDIVKYDIGANLVVYRADVYGNEVDYYLEKSNNTLLDFPFGNLNIVMNKVKGNSYILFTNSFARIQANVIENSSIIDTTPSVSVESFITLNTLSNGSVISSVNTQGSILWNTVDNGSILVDTVIGVTSKIIANNIIQGSTLEFGTIAGGSTIGKNTLIGRSRAVVLTFTGASFEYNYLSNSSLFNITNNVPTKRVTGCEISDNITIDLGVVSIDYINKKYREGYSNWECDLDCADPLIYGGAILTIPVTKSYVGIFNTINVAISIGKILNAPTNHQFLVRPTASAPLIRINSPVVSVTVAVAGDIIANETTILNAPFYNANYRANGCDEFGFKTFGNLIGWNVRNIWQ